MIAESPEILKIGLLFGEDVNATTMDLPAVLTFQHKLIQEYLAAVYISENIKQPTSARFLAEALPIKEKMVQHREVLMFACGILAETDNACPLVYHIASVLVQDINEQLSLGKNLDLSGMDIVLKPCEKESGITGINPYICEYPACGYPLAQVLAASKLVYINTVSPTDSLKFNYSSADIILHIGDANIFDKLFEAFEKMGTNVIALDLHQIRSVNVTKLSRFSKLKRLNNSIFLAGREVEAMENLAESIHSWGAEPPLTYCKLGGSLSESVVSSLCLCTRLLNIDLNQCILREKLCLLMASPPPALRELHLYQCFLSASDIDLIAQAVKGFKLSHLEELDISGNKVGEPVVHSLLEAFATTRPNVQITIRLSGTGLKVLPQDSLSDEFVAKWKTKLRDTKIIALFSLMEQMNNRSFYM